MNDSVSVTSVSESLSLVTAQLTADPFCVRLAIIQRFINM